MDVALTTARLRLRPPVPTDAPAIARHLNNFSVTGKLSVVPYPYGEADARDWIANQAEDRGPDGHCFMLTMGADEAIGACGLTPDPKGATLGYWLGEPYWNRGMMTEAAAAVIGWYFAASGATALRSGAFAFNRASLAVQHKLGFTETGQGQRHCLARRQDLRHIDTTLTRAAWQDRTGAPHSQATA